MTIIKVALWDIDGVLTDNRIYHFDGGIRGRAFCGLDSKGFWLLKEGGVKVWLNGGSDEPHMLDRIEWLGVDGYLLEPKDKRLVLDYITGAILPEMAFMGNDVPDLPLLEMVGFPACPIDAHDDVLEFVSDHPEGYVSQRRGGEGAARDFCDWILRHNAEQIAQNVVSEQARRDRQIT